MGKSKIFKDQISNHKDHKSGFDFRSVAISKLNFEKLLMQPIMWLFIQIQMQCDSNLIITEYYKYTTTDLYEVPDAVLPIHAESYHVLPLCTQLFNITDNAFTILHT